MARIPVTTELITDQDLQNIMLFDPYNWRDLALRIEWGLNNRQTLLAKQKDIFNRLMQRSWRDVVDEYVMILDELSNHHRIKTHQSMARKALCLT
ncbi:hypothetical protein [Legionella fairfieldensis]|uniref:hypothetical protein n=1 Tax=Legionella fairfieldensis TaxID=45064 RepID=UPI00048B1AA6|nr:hypothetical protein [Legionella fairfieldensis]